MKDRKITYRNKVELLIALVAYAVIFLPLISFILISDITKQSEHLLHNFLSLCLIVAVSMIPLLIVARYRIVFDYENRTIVYVHYFMFKRIISFDDVQVRYIKNKMKPPAYDFVFYVKGKKIFKLSPIDFERQTDRSADHLKALFTGTEKFWYDWELRYKKQGVFVYIQDYSSIASDKTLYLSEEYIRIELEYSVQKEQFDIKVRKLIIENNYEVGDELLEELCVVPADVNAVCDKLLLTYRREG